MKIDRDAKVSSPQECCRLPERIPIRKWGQEARAISPLRHGGHGVCFLFLSLLFVSPLGKCRGGAAMLVSTGYVSSGLLGRNNANHHEIRVHVEHLCSARRFVTILVSSGVPLANNRVPSRRQLIIHKILL